MRNRGPEQRERCGKTVSGFFESVLVSVGELVVGVAHRDIVEISADDRRIRAFLYVVQDSVNLVRPLNDSVAEFVVHTDDLVAHLFRESLLGPDFLKQGGRGNGI